MLITEITVDSVDDDCETALKVINRGNLYVSRFAGGKCFFVSKKGKSNELKIILYNPEIDLDRQWDIPQGWFSLFATVILYDSEDHYEITGNRDNLIDCYKGISKSLMAFHASMYEKYGVRLEP